MATRRQRIGKVAEKALYGIAGGISALAGGRGPRGATASDEVFRYRKVSLRRYRDGKAKRICSTPVIFVPPFMVRPHVYDLDHGHSFVATLIEHGFDVYTMDFGDPSREDAHLRLDDYVLEFMPRLADAAIEISGGSRTTLIGYSMGGIFSYLLAAVFPEKTAAIVPLAAPVDCHKMGLFSAMARLAGRPGVNLVRLIGNIPGQLASVAFRVAAPLKSASRLAALVPKLWDQEYLRRYAALNQWVNDFADWPEAAFRQFVNEFMGENRLARGKLKLGGQRVDLREITCPILAFAGKTDRIAPPAACRALLKHVSSRDAICVEVPGGHLGIVVARSAPVRVWARTAEWLRTRTK
jgi:polyhydroxyalkanoate synthase